LADKAAKLLPANLYMSVPPEKLPLLKTGQISVIQLKYMQRLLRKNRLIREVGRLWKVKLQFGLLGKTHFTKKVFNDLG